MESYSFSSLLGLKDVRYRNLLADVIKRFSLHSYIHNFLIKFIHLNQNILVMKVVTIPMICLPL